MDRVERLLDCRTVELDRGVLCQKGRGDRAWTVIGARGVDGVRYQRVRFAEAQARIAYQGIGEFGHGHEVRAGSSRQALAVYLRRSQQPSQQTQRARRVGKHGEHQRLKIVFAVVDVAERGVVRAGENGLRFSQRAAGQDAGVLERHRIAFLRHDAGRLDVRVGEAHKAKFPRGPQQQILHQLSGVDHGDGDGGGGFGEVIDGRDRTVGVLGQAVEAEQLGGELAVDGKPGCGDGARAHRAQVDAREGGLNPRGVSR